MSRSYISNWRILQYRAYSRFLKNWDWEWLATLTFRARYHRCRSNLIKAELFKWTRELCVSEHLQVGYYYVLCFDGGHPHLHLVMVGRGRVADKVKRLEDVNRRKWERRWPFFAKIEIPRSNSAAAKYIARHVFWTKCERAYIDSFNIKLLTKERKME